MRLSFGQEMRQVQKQILAPRMIQSMEILQLAVQALEERIEEEMQENPVLELRDEDPDLPEEQVEAEDPNAPTQEERVLVVDETKDNKDDFERLVNSDDEWLESFDERPRVSSQRVAEEGDRKHDAMANMEARPPSLQDHLREQLGWLEIDEVTRAMADRIIYNLDANGFLPGRLEDILDPNATRDELALAEKALAVVQKLDPLGVAARDLRECLLLQLNPKMDHYEELRVLIGDHLDDLMHNRLPQIQRRTGMSMDEIHDTIQELRKLKLRPAADFADAHVPNVTPDVYLEEGDNGEFKVFLQDGRTPSLCISPYYRKLLMQEGTSDAEKEWIKRKINSAQWLMDSIEQRRSTLTKISQAIVDHQVAFLRKGPEFIEPLKMQQIADKVGSSRRQSCNRPDNWPAPAPATYRPASRPSCPQYPTDSCQTRQTSRVD